MARSCYLLPLLLAITLGLGMSDTANDSSPIFNFDIVKVIMHRLSDWDELLPFIAESKGWSQKQIEEIQMEDKMKYGRVREMTMELYGFVVRQGAALSGIGEQPPMEDEEYLKEELRRLDEIDQLTFEREQWLKGLEVEGEL